MAAAAVAPALPAQPGRGRLARTPAARSRQLLRECSKRSGSPWGGEGERSCGGEEGGGGKRRGGEEGDRESRLGRAAAQLHPARLSGAAHSI